MQTFLSRWVRNLATVPFIQVGGRLAGAKRLGFISSAIPTRIERMLDPYKTYGPGMSKHSIQELAEIYGRVSQGLEKAQQTLSRGSVVVLNQFLRDAAVAPREDSPAAKAALDAALRDLATAMVELGASARWSRCPQTNLEAHAATARTPSAASSVPRKP